MSSIVMDRPHPREISIDGRVFLLRAGWPEPHLRRVVDVTVYEHADIFTVVRGEWTNYDEACEAAERDVKRLLSR